MNSRLLHSFAFFAVCGAASATMISIPVDITTGTGSSASQSTTHPAGPANNGIDGNLGNFTHTNPPEAGNANAWWQVDLASDRTFSVVRITNRGDGCCGYRLRDLSIYVYDAGNTLIYTTTGINAGNGLGSPSFIDLALPSTLTNARYVRVERTPYDNSGSHDAATLSIGELQVFNWVDNLLPAGSDLTHSNIANLSVSQSSLYNGNSYPSGNAINGITGSAGDFTHTDSNDANASWTVDLGEVMNLEGFDISNRVGCCPERLRDITVTVKDALGFGTFSTSLLNPENSLGGPASLTGSFPSGTQGRFVTISRLADPDHSGNGGLGGVDDSNVLSMSEVRIFGSSIPEPSGALLLLSLAVAGLMRRRR